MDRREALKRTALLMGTAVSAPSIMAILNGCSAKPEIDWKPQFFNESEAYIVTRVAEIIIPKTDTPGAKEVGVPGFIDLILKDVYAEDDQKRFMEGLKSFNEGAEDAHGGSFADLDEEDQTAYVTKVHGDAIKEQYSGNPPAKRPFIMTMKELTMLGYFTSEVGATQVLQYDPVPGAYKGCIPVSEAGNGKTWASS